MEYINVLNESLKERFIAEAKIEASKNEIINIVQSIVVKKFKGSAVICNGLEFDFFDVNASINTYDNNIETKTISLSLAFFYNGKLPKVKREKINEAKSIFKEKKYLIYNNYKIRLWKSFEYELELNNAITGNFVLDLIYQFKPPRIADLLIF